MKVALIADTYTPLRSSGAVQLRDLSREFARQGHDLTVMLPDAVRMRPWALEEVDGVQVLRLRAPRIKDVGYLRRTIAEFLMPFFMRLNLRKSPLADEVWDSVVWYSPSIFHGPFIRFLKTRSQCKSYLIIRDIFPEWAVDMGLMRRGMAYRFFGAIARYQYSVADVIGVQTSGNKVYFDDWLQNPSRKLEVLQNWLDKPAEVRCPIRVNETTLAGRKILVYAGNMGVAQGMWILLDLAEKLRAKSDVGFLFIGRGNEAKKLKAAAQLQGLDNVLFFDEIQPDEIPDLFAQCAIGIVALDPRHKSHNIPGKFLTYMQTGLPVLANINAGNDLAQVIRDHNVGQVCDSNQLDDLIKLSEALFRQIETDPGLPMRCHALFKREYSVDRAVSQIVNALG